MRLCSYCNGRTISAFMMMMMMMINTNNALQITLGAKDGRDVKKASLRYIDVTRGVTF